MSAAPRAQPQRRGRGTLRVLFLPDYGRGNAYQRELRAALEALGILVSGARAPNRSPFGLLTAWLRHRRPRVIHLHWTHAYLGQKASGRHRRWQRLRGGLLLLQVAVLRTVGVRVIWTLHNLGIHDEPTDAPLNVAVHRRLIRLANATIAHCQEAVNAAVSTYGLDANEEAKLCVIPHGSYVDVYGPRVSRDDARARLGYPQGVRVLLFIGAVRGYKGAAELIHAFHVLPGESLRLLVAGKPFKQADAEAVRRAAQGDTRINLRLEFVPDEELPVLLGAADAVVLPFRDVLTSGSAILAMSYGRAVVAPALGCLPETLDERGSILYDRTAEGALGEALMRALSADLDAMGETNLALARRMAWAPIAVATAELYRGGRPGGATVWGA